MFHRYDPSELGLHLLCELPRRLLLRVDWSVGCVGNLRGWSLLRVHGLCLLELPHGHVPDHFQCAELRELCVRDLPLKHRSDNLIELKTSFAKTQKPRAG